MKEWKDRWERVELSPDERHQALERIHSAGTRQDLMAACQDLMAAFAQARGRSVGDVRLYYGAGQKEDVWLMCWRVPPPEPSEGQ